MSHRAIVLGGGVAAFSVFLAWEYHGRKVASQQAAQAAQDMASSSALAALTQTTELTNIPAEGELPFNGGGVTTTAPTIPVTVAPYVIGTPLPDYTQPIPVS